MRKQTRETGRNRRRYARLEKENIHLREALGTAQSANRAKSTFLSNMSHDIRTPMNAIMGMTSIGLSHIDEKARVQDCLLKIQTASTHLMSLVNDVLDMSRIDSGRMTISEEEFSLPDLVHDIAVIIRPQALQKNQSLILDIGEIYEEELVGDPLRLRQILVNIIGNAVKYTGENGRIRVSFSQHLCADNQAEGKDRVWLDFSCEDNGMGMSREFLKRIFVPFERVNNEATSKIEGTGLGMSIVKNLIDRMGGEIQVESEEGEGSCFRVTLLADVSRRDRKSPNLTAGATVLIAEALEHRSGKICGFLRECGLVPVVVTSGLTAVTWLTEAQYENRMPCAMLLGQKLEDTPSLELASHIRQLAGASFPILLVSETDWSQIEYRATRAGINAFVPCPLFKSRLLETMSRLLNAGQEDSDKGIDGDYGGCHVLLVEDNELNQEIALELLSLIGVNVETADNGQEALELFEASDENYFDVIFMDIQMPVMDGYEAARRIRRLNRPDAGEVFIVAMTANAFVEDIRLSREAGMNDHISKPIDFEHLKEILSRQLKIRKS